MLNYIQDDTLLWPNVQKMARKHKAIKVVQVTFKPKVPEYPGLSTCVSLLA